MIELRRLTPDDFALLRRWLTDPRVARWWVQEATPEAVARDFGPASRGERPVDDLVVLLDGRPVGLVKRYRLDDFPDDRDELARIIDVPTGAMAIDYLLGEAADQGRGLGPQVIRTVTDRLFDEFLYAPCVIVPVAAANRASWRALEKAGFRRVGEGELEPDHPDDDRLHVISRLDRP